ncbi:laccase [Cellulomonas bogoriensis 69B4 = DSM 16987]|uniref:Laccase n=1 Tax=Cellulomonas bogoriensis 69B4 = DSM 16987 TaxID=1386082 RepID=A0A0A0BNI9_9CELL|nr:laccase [Cellulomonas bogoriensis 69B4 = DSM 16987]
MPLVEVDLGPGVRAGFSTVGLAVGRGPGGRPGDAVSAFNLGLGLHEPDELVLARREAVAGYLGAPLAWVHQVHGSTVHVVGEPGPGPRPSAEADGLVTTRRDVGLAVVVADCVPVLLADPGAGVSGAAHAGREGVVAGVVPAVVAAMVSAGARREHLRAFVGPAACGRCYEVPSAMRADVAARLPATASRTVLGTPALDLPAGVCSQLEAAGVGSVTALGCCTIEDQRWFSHRGTSRGGPQGRFAGVVRCLPASSTGT